MDAFVKCKIQVIPTNISFFFKLDIKHIASIGQITTCVLFVQAHLAFIPSPVFITLKFKALYVFASCTVVRAALRMRAI